MAILTNTARTYMNLKNGILKVSLDFAFYWGLTDKQNIAQNIENFLRSKKLYIKGYIPLVLEKISKHYATLNQSHGKKVT